MVLKVIAPLWIGLGCYRGVKLYNYTYNKYETDKNNENPYFYARCFYAGLFGGFVYVNPFILPITISKEIYRLEVNIRGLNEEKDKHSFYKLL